MRLSSSTVAWPIRKQATYQKAISDYDVAIRLEPENTAAYFNRGNAYFALDDFRQAIQDYTVALRLDPNLALAYCYRGLAYLEKGDVVRGKADQDKASRLNPALDRN